MSMEISVFFTGKLPDTAALSQAMKELGFPISIPERDPLETQKGFLPMRFGNEETGVEFDVFDGRDDIEEIANGCEVDPAFDRSANFRWGGDFNEMLCAVCASAALARLVGGVVMGEDHDEPISADEAISDARQYLKPAAEP